jgi:hypothetical protein
MNRRHAAALALVGWYLMMPSSLSQNGQIAALSHWTTLSRFEAKRDCEAKRLKQTNLDPSLGAYGGLPPEEVYDAQCIATDDPRLKGN